MDAPDKLLSVIVPSYNMEEYLPKCLGSLVVPDEAMLRRLDVIIVNDGSKDRTSEIAHDFERRFPGVFRVIDKPNGNYGSCINAALPIAAGFYIKVLDADDSVDPAAFVTLLGALETETHKGQTSADLVVTDYVKVDPCGHILERTNYGFPAGSGHTLLDTDENAPRFTIHSVVYRSSILLDMGYRQTEGMSYTDTEWIIEPMTRVHQVTYVPVAVTRYLVGRSGQTMEDRTFASHIDQVAQITTGLISRYAENAIKSTPESLPYYRKNINYMVSMVYGSVFFGWKGFPASCDLRPLNEALRKNPEIRRLAENLRAPSSKCPIRFVRAYLQHPGKGTPAFLLMTAFYGCRKFYHSLRTPHSH